MGGLENLRRILTNFISLIFFPIIKKWKLEFEFEKIGGDVVDIKYI
jgi:hypothetical protein